MKINTFKDFLRIIFKNALAFKLKNKINNKLFTVIKKKDLITQQFVNQAGYYPNIDSPQTFNEKIQWLKLYNKDPLMTQCADKYRVRKYIKERIGSKYLIRLLFAYDKVDQIDFNQLPDRFILKVNHGSGQNIICENKNNFDVKEAKQKLREWIKPESNHYFYSFEWCYKNIKPKIVCEEFLEDLNGKDLKDYKFMCFNGKVKVIFVCSERKASLKVDFFDLNWKKLPFIRYYPNSQKQIPSPKNLGLMIELAEKIAKPFYFVRVDFYETKGLVYFGEMTFYPGNGMEPFNPIDWDYRLGSMLKLPKKDDIPVNQNGLENWLVAKEIYYGGIITNVPRKKVSPFDPRTQSEINEGGMIGGDRMLYHGYAKKYAEYLIPFVRKKRVVLAEFGILTGVGLAYWCDLFSKGKIYGFDIDLNHFKDNFKYLKNLGAFSKIKPEIFEFDQFIDNKKYLKNIFKNEKINLCIDDGFHSDESILKTINSVLPFLSEDFVYFIEDNSEVHKKIKQFYPELNICNEGELTILSNKSLGRDL